MEKIKSFTLGLLTLLSGITGFSQSTLEVHTTCGFIPPYGVDTYYSIDGITVEESGCAPWSQFYAGQLYVAIIDTSSIAAPSCSPLGTRFNGFNPGNNFGNYNDNGGCRSRVEKYFMYLQTDTGDMASLDSLINFWIPNGFTFVIYSWNSYDYHIIDSLCPALGLTLVNNWGSNAGLDHHAAILYGVKGNPSTYDFIFSDNPTGFAHLTKQFCMQGSSSGINQLYDEEEIITYPNPFTNCITIGGTNNTSTVTLYNALGELLESWVVTTTDHIIQTGHLKPGIYFLNVQTENGTTMKRIIKQ